jgi:hypothetical protein
MRVQCFVFFKNPSALFSLNYVRHHPAFGLLRSLSDVALDGLEELWYPIFSWEQRCVTRCKVLS